MLLLDACCSLQSQVDNNQINQASLAPVQGDPADETPAPSDAGSVAPTTVELAFKWGKEEVKIHAEPEETVQVRCQRGSRSASAPLGAATNSRSTSNRKHAPCPSLPRPLPVPPPPPARPSPAPCQALKRKLEAATAVSEKRIKLLGLKVRQPHTAPLAATSGRAASARWSLWASHNSHTAPPPYCR